jgi:hypothetical protein
MCACGGVLRYPSTGQCKRCYQRDWFRDNYRAHARALAADTQRLGPRVMTWRETGTKHCRLCSRTLPIERFGMQKNGQYVKPYTYCKDCRAWKNHERAVERSRGKHRKGAQWRGDTLEEARQWVFEQHWGALQ